MTYKSVKGVDRVVDSFRLLPDTLESEIINVISDKAQDILQDMQNMTPVDVKNPGPHAKDGLSILFEKGGLRALIGLPTKELVSRFFWWRFLDQGTQGGTVSYDQESGLNRIKKTMNVPQRPALRIRERALDGNMKQILSEIQAVISRKR